MSSRIVNSTWLKYLLFVLYTKRSGRELHRTEGAGDVWNDFLRHGKSKKRCPLCMRDMNDKDMATYEKIVGTLVLCLSS